MQFSVARNEGILRMVNIRTLLNQWLESLWEDVIREGIQVQYENFLNLFLLPNILKINHEMAGEFSNIASDKNFTRTFFVARPERKKQFGAHKLLPALYNGYNFWAMWPNIMSALLYNYKKIISFLISKSPNTYDYLLWG
jgi:hypothetical protein